MSAPSECPICLGADLVREGGYRNPDDIHAGTFSHLSIFVCQECGYGFTHPRIDQEALGRYYAAEYEMRNFAKATRTNIPIADFRSMAQLYLGTLFCDFQPGDTFLDVGTGAGTSLHSARVLLDNPSLAIVELNETTIAMLRQRHPQLGVYPTVADFARDRKAKLALMSHSLEHFEGVDVRPTLADLKASMAPGGTLVVEVPHWDLRVYTKRRNDVPHLGFFSVSALERALQQAGFQVMYSGLFGFPMGVSRKDFNAAKEAEFDVLNMKDEVAINAFKALRTMEFRTQSVNGKWIRAVARV